MTQQIRVGSLNPVKISSALAGFNRLFEGPFSASGLAVPSGVSEQPMSDEETLTGATNRADAVRAQDADCDFAVGIEGGITRLGGQFYTAAWIVINDAEGRVARGRSGTFALPPRVQQLVLSGMELGHANDLVFEEHNSKQSGGAVGSLTGGVISRAQLYEHAMILALVPFKNRLLFDA